MSPTNLEQLPLRRRALLSLGALVSSTAWKHAEPQGPLRLGVVVWIPKDGDPSTVIRRVRELGFSCCQLGVRSPSSQLAEPIRKALRQYDVEATALLCLGGGRMVWNLKDGPATIGLVPRETRGARMEALKQASDLAKACKINAVHTHFGFIPETESDPLYKEVIPAIREVASHAQRNGQIILCETGQETPITLLRTIQSVGATNVFVNLDTANLLLYGKGNPVDALAVLGKYVRGVHAKDGQLPDDPAQLGKEVPIGKGRVDFREIFQRLHELNYRNTITIENEIEGSEQAAEIMAARDYLTSLIRTTYV